MSDEPTASQRVRDGAAVTHEFHTDDNGTTELVLYELPPIEVPWWHRILPWETDRQREVRGARQHLRYHGHWPAYPLDWGPCYRCTRER